MSSEPEILGVDRVEERFGALPRAGLDFGDPLPVTEDYWEEKERALPKRVGKTIVPQ
jgi:hypothetical protein